MKKFTDETLKELVIYLLKRDLNTNTSIAGMLDEIRDWAEDNDIENDVEVEAIYCRMEETTSGLWEYAYVDGIAEKEYDNKYFVIDVTTEGGGIVIYVTHADEDDPFL